MSGSTTAPPPPLPSLSNNPSRWPITLVTIIFLPVFAATLIYHYEFFDPAELPVQEILGRPAMVAPAVNGRMLDGSERIGEGDLPGPEGVACDAESGLIYTGCNDGWVKRVRVNDSALEEWVHTGSRPLGLVLGRRGEVVWRTLKSKQGLLRVSQNGAIELLTDEAEGVKFKLTDGVDLVEDGTIYFKDATHKYSFKEHIWDFLEGRPQGRFMRFDPETRRTDVLVRDLYFANGVAISPDQDFVLFCETLMNRCLRYYITDEKNGTVNTFVDRLPGLPDNIWCDGEGHYWIALAMEVSLPWQWALRYLSIRKGLAILEKYLSRPHVEKNGRSFVVDLEGNPVAHYYDPRLSFVSGTMKIGNYMYCGSIAAPFITRLDLTKYGARQVLM